MYNTKLVFTNVMTLSVLFLHGHYDRHIITRSSRLVIDTHTIAKQMFECNSVRSRICEIGYSKDEYIS